MNYLARQPEVQIQGGKKTKKYVRTSSLTLKLNAEDKNCNI